MKRLLRWFPQSLSSRLLVTYVTLMALGIGSVMALTGQRIASENIQQTEHELELQAHIIANALRDPLQRTHEGETTGGRSLDALIASYATSIGGRVVLLDAQRNIVLSSDPRLPVHTEDNHPEFAAASAGTEQYDIRMDEWSKQERLFVAAPIFAEHSQPLGFVQVSVPTAPIYAEVWQLWLSLIGIAGIVLLITVIASALLARQIAIPVQSLTVTSEQIAAGRLDERVTPAGPSETRRLGIAFNRMADRVQEMIGQQRAFVDNAAHELRSPLTSLRLRLEMLQTHGQGDAELTRRYLEQMEREIGYLQRLTDHLLALATVEEGVDAPRVPLDLSHLLYEFVDHTSAVVQQAGLTLRVDVPDHLPRIVANPEQISMLIRNLVDNAIHYTHRGGTVTLAARAANGGIEIRVSDTGMGIPPEELAHIFDRFYRVDRARTRRQGGTGLGLSLVQSIAHAHGGRVEVDSRVNVGTTFTVYLPIGQRRENTAAK
jgi:signal transduction histidine kinase